MNCAIEQAAGCTLIPFPVLDSEQRALVLRWRNNPEVSRWMFQDRQIQLEEHQRFAEGLRTDRRNAYWLSCDAAGSPRGVLSLTRIDPEHQTAYLGIYANPEQPVPGTGKALMRALHHMAFVNMHLHTLKLEVFAGNTKAIHLYESIGYQREGLLREYIKIDSGRSDVVIMGILAMEAGS